MLLLLLLYCESDLKILGKKIILNSHLLSVFPFLYFISVWRTGSLDQS